MCHNFGVLDTARAVEFRMSWMRLSETGEDSKTESCSSRVRVNKRCGNSVGSCGVESVSYSPKVTDR